MLVTNWIVQASNITSGKKMAAVSIHKWTVRFFLVFLIYPSANARGGHLDWIELADEIVHQQWCGTTDYCGFRNQSDDPATTESSTNEGLRKMTVQKPNDMKENQSVYICLSFYAFHDRCLTKHFHYKHWKKKNTNRFLNTACHCDEECDSYGDCCYDALLANIHTEVKNNISEEEFEQNSLACLPLRFKDNDYKLDEKVTYAYSHYARALRCTQLPCHHALRRRSFNNVCFAFV